MIKELKARRSRCLTKEIEHKTAAIDDEISKLSALYTKSKGWLLSPLFQEAVDSIDTFL